MAMSQLVHEDETALTTNASWGVQNQDDFSLVQGGPLYRLLLRTGMINPLMGLLHRRIVVCILVTWLPLALLTAVAGTFIGGVGVPFLVDLDTHVRLLISIPLVIGAELIIHRRVRSVVDQFRERELIAPEDSPRFEAIIARAMRLRNSIWVEVFLLLLSFTGGYWLWRARLALPVSTWYAEPAEGTVHTSAAGFWFAFVSQPIARFILYRWYFRLIVWYVFLWKVSRLRLRLNPLHPDRAGGLAFLSTAVDAFTVVLIAQTIFLAGLIGNRIWHAGASLPDFKFEIAGVILLLMLVVLAPLTFFVFHTVEAKLAALREYGLLASRYTQEFRQKWLQDGKGADDTLLGSGDIQSLADLANSYEVVRTMRLLPFDRGFVLRLAILIAMPLLPLLLTMMPFEEMMQRLVNLLL